MKNYYHILGLSFESAPEVQLIEAAYKALVKLYHPDVYKGDKKTLNRKITEINEAYDVLSQDKKKIIYDEKLKKFQINKSIDYSDEEFEDKDLFDKKYIDADWEIALLVYPELEKKKQILSKYSQKLSFQFQFYLLETKEFYKLDIITNRFIEAFLERKFGTSVKIKLFSKILIENGYRKNAIYLNKLIKVIGSNSENRIIKTFFKQFPHLESFLTDEIKFYKRLPINGKDNNQSQKIIVLFLMIILIIFFITIINS